MFPPLRFAFRFAFLFLAASLAHAVPWPKAESDLPPDPAIRWGALPNGLRYVIQPNAEPKNRVSLRLLVSVGSLHETDEERGLAHFVEHMAFRGTRRHPGDSLSQELSKLGIGLGPDSTAFTGYNYTVYHLELPDASETTLRRGLDVFREYASELTFDPALIERERGVILSEKATRDTPDARLGLAQLRFLFPNSREARRVPIGLDTSIRRFSREQFVAFYDAWYRPERLAVVIVGNVTTEAAERLVTETFDSLTARAPAREEPTDLLNTTVSKPTIDGWLDVGLVGISFSIEHPFPEPIVPDSAARRTRALHRSMGLSILQKRLARVAHAANGAFVSPSATLSSPLPGWLVVNIAASGAIDNWQQFTTTIEQEHRRVMFHGFTDAEIAEARANVQLFYDQNVRSAATRRSEQLAAVLEGALLYGQVVATPETIRDDATRILAATDAAKCLEAFRALWGASSPHVFLGSNPALNIHGPEIARVLNASRNVAVTPPVARAPVSFAYPSASSPGAIVRHESVEDMDIHLAEFGNGVRFNFKSTTFEADTVNATLRVGTGSLSLPYDQPGLSLLANSTLIRGGVRRHSQDEIRELLAGHALQVNFQVLPDACVFYLRCSRAELTLCLQLVTAYLTDAAYRPEAMREAQADFGSMYANLAASASGTINFRAERLMFRNDPRFGFPQQPELFARTLAEVSAWLEPQFKTGPIEIGLTGDVSWEDASTAVAHTVGALPPRSPRPDLSARSVVTFQTPSAAPYVNISGPQVKQSSIAWFWPLPDVQGIQAERRCRFLTEALSDRLRLRLREELGAAYAPTAAYVEYEGFPGLSYLVLAAEVAPAQMVRAAEIVRRELTELRSRGFSEADFLRIRPPFLRAREDDLRENSYWNFTVLQDAQQRPERLAAARNRAVDTAAITRAEINALARRYLDPARGFMFVAEPKLTHVWNKK